MHYVKHFNINGVDTKQVACIELHGKPNAATEGAVGALGIDLDSPAYDVYKCVAVNGSIYTWELLSSGFSVICATVSGEGATTYRFDFRRLVLPAGYVVKIGDLIIDSKGYLYSIASFGTDYCYGAYRAQLGSGGSGSAGEDGVGIESVTQTTTSSVSSGTNVITVTLTDGTKSTFTVRNGAKGDKGDTYVLTDEDKSEIASMIDVGSGGNSVEIVQTTGTSETAVMSQKATTEAIAVKLNSRYDCYGYATMDEASYIKITVPNTNASTMFDLTIRTDDGNPSGYYWSTWRITLHCGDCAGHCTTILDGASMPDALYYTSDSDNTYIYVHVSMNTEVYINGITKQISATIESVETRPSDAVEIAINKTNKLYQHHVKAYLAGSSNSAYFYLTVYKSSPTPLCATLTPTPMPNEFIAAFLAGHNIYMLQLSDGTRRQPIAAYLSGTNAMKIDYITSIDAANGTFTSTGFAFPLSNFVVSEYTVSEV